MSSAKRTKRWAIVPPSSDTSDRVAEGLSISPETEIPETLRSHRPMDAEALPGRNGPSSPLFGTESGEYEKVGARWTAAEAGSGVSRRQKRRRKPNGVDSAPDVPRAPQDPSAPRDRETLFEGFAETELELDTWSPPGAASRDTEWPGTLSPPDTTPGAIATLMSPGSEEPTGAGTGDARRGAEQADGEGEGGPTSSGPAENSRRRTGRRRIREEQTQNSIPDVVLDQVGLRPGKRPSAGSSKQSRDDDAERTRTRNAETLTPDPPRTVSGSGGRTPFQTLRSKVNRAPQAGRTPTSAPSTDPRRTDSHRTDPLTEGPSATEEHITRERSSQRRSSRRGDTVARESAQRATERREATGESLGETASRKSSEGVDTIPAPPWHDPESSPSGRSRG